MIARCLRHRAPVLWLLLPFMGGVIAGKNMPAAWPVGWWLGGAVFAAGLAVWRVSSRVVWPAALIVSLFLSGLVACELRRARLEAWDALPPREVRVTVEIERLFPAAADGRKTSGLARITRAAPHLQEIVGQRVYFSLFNAGGGSAPARSSEVDVLGVLEALPYHAPPATFEGFLASAGINFRLTRGRVIAETRAAGAYARFCEKALARFGGILSDGLERRPELAGSLRAMLLGQKHELSEEQRTQFQLSGTMHLFAISGLHIVVIALALHGVLGLLRLPRAVQVLVGVAALWLYVDITGASPSAVRAFWMIALTHATLVLRWPVNPVATLSFAALLALLLDPLQLFSASFILSYGIVAALLLLGLPLSEYWVEKHALFADLPKATWRWHQHARDRLWRALLGAVALGLATTLVSTVCGVVFFQLFTPGGLLANLVLIPLSSLVVLAGFLSLVCGMDGVGVACVVFNHAAALVLACMEQGIAWMLKIPGFFWTVEFRAPWLGFATLGVVLGAFAHGYARQWTRGAGGFWPPFAVTLLALVMFARFR